MVLGLRPHTPDTTFLTTFLKPKMRLVEGDKERIKCTYTYTTQIEVKSTKKESPSYTSVKN